MFTQPITAINMFPCFCDAAAMQRLRACCDCQPSSKRRVDSCDMSPLPEVKHTAREGARECGPAQGSRGSDGHTRWVCLTGIERRDVDK